MSQPFYQGRVLVADTLDENINTDGGPPDWMTGGSGSGNVPSQEAPAPGIGLIAATEELPVVLVTRTEDATGRGDDAPDMQPILRPQDPEMELHSGAGLVAAHPAQDDTGQPLVKAATHIAIGLVLAALFSRLHANRLANHPLRAQVLSLIESQPGIRIHHVAERLEERQSLIAYHVKMMADHGVLKVERVGTATHLFPIESTPTTRKQIAAASHPTAARILTAIEEEPGVQLKDIQQATGASPSLAHYHLRKLVDAGAVHVIKNGRNQYFAGHQVTAALA